MPHSFAPFLKDCADDPSQHADLACGGHYGYAPRLCQPKRPGAERARQEPTFGPGVCVQGPDYPPEATILVRIEFSIDGYRPEGSNENKQSNLALRLSDRSEPP